jgi:hypothetical protein
MKMNFVKPTFLRGGKKVNKDNLVFLTASKKGLKSKSDYYDISFKNFLDEYNLDWKYVAFAFESTGLYLTPVEENNEYGFMVSKHHKVVTNTSLVVSILKFFKKQIPLFPDDKIKINFNIESLGNNIYQLKIK